MSGITSRGMRLAPAGAAVLGSLVLMGAPARASTPSYYNSSHPLHVVATLDTCHSGPTPADRYGTFAGQMMSVAKADSMAMRFTLVAHLPGELAPRRLSAPGLDVWEHSKSKVNIFRYSQEVANLPAGGT